MPAVRQPTAEAVGPATEPAMVPMTSPAMIPASNSDYSVLPDPLAINPNSQERRASSRLAQSKTLTLAGIPLPPPTLVKMSNSASQSKTVCPHPLTPAPISDGPGPCQVVIERRISQRLAKALAVGRAARPETVATAKQLVPPPKPIEPCQKGQNAQQLAIEEAERYGGAVGKCWHQ